LKIKALDDTPVEVQVGHEVLVFRAAGMPTLRAKVTSVNGRTLSVVTEEGQSRQFLADDSCLRWSRTG